MGMIYLQTIGVFVFFITTIVLGILLRISSSNKVHVTTILIVHLIANICYLPSILLGPFYLVFSSYDEQLGIQPLQSSTVSTTLALAMLLVGIFLFVAANITLLTDGKGLPAFLLSSKVAKRFSYRLTRNPMSLGLYLVYLAFGILAGSRYFTLWVLAGVIPSHVFYLKFFEEKELAIRFGQRYLEYNKNVPFLFPTIRSLIKKDRSRQHNPNSTDRIGNPF